MAKRNFIPVPRDVTERYGAGEQVTHQLMKRAGNICFWRSTLNRDALSKPEQVRYHLTDAGSAFVLLESDGEQAFNYFTSAVMRQANREHYFQVAYDFKEANGQKVSGVPLSRKIARVGTMRRVHRRLLRTNSQAYCMECRVYC